jgi:pyoverdine/dityrosine biosynthesis protein Dit1
MMAQSPSFRLRESESMLGLWNSKLKHLKYKAFNTETKQGQAMNMYLQKDLHHCLRLSIFPGPLSLFAHFKVISASFPLALIVK